MGNPTETPEWVSYENKENFQGMETTHTEAWENIVYTKKKNGSER